VHIKKSSRTRALMAIGFAGGVLGSYCSVQSEGAPVSTDSMMQQILGYTKIGPEFRAFYLLRLANRYLEDDDIAESERSMRSFVSSSTESWLHAGSRMENVLVAWTNELAPLKRPAPAVTDKETAAQIKALKVKKTTNMADAAIQQALLQLEQSSDTFSKLNMYFIASCLFKKVDDRDGVWKCNALLENAVQACERSSQIDEGEIKGSSSVLNAMAFGILPVIIPDQNRAGVKWEPTTPLEVFTEKEFTQSEKLKLRAAALTDKLDNQNHLRRKAHRDLALWYLHLGKMQQAESQKQTLFDLIGPREDSLLFPRVEACGELVWWHTGKINMNMDCGMG
jgi:hypothetical protein